MQFCENNFAMMGIIMGVTTTSNVRGPHLVTCELRRHEPLSESACKRKSYNSESCDLQPESTASEPAVVSLLDHLRAPQRMS